MITELLRLTVEQQPSQDSVFTWARTLLPLIQNKDELTADSIGTAMEIVLNILVATSDYDVVAADLPGMLSAINSFSFLGSEIGISRRLLESNIETEKQVLQLYIANLMQHLTYGEEPIVEIYSDIRVKIEASDAIHGFVVLASPLNSLELSNGIESGFNVNISDDSSYTDTIFSCSCSS